MLHVPCCMAHAPCTIQCAAYGVRRAACIAPLVMNPCHPHMPPVPATSHRTARPLLTLTNALTTTLTTALTTTLTTTVTLTLSGTPAPIHATGRCGTYAQDGEAGTA